MLKIQVLDRCPDCEGAAMTFLRRDPYYFSTACQLMRHPWIMQCSD